MPERIVVVGADIGKPDGERAEGYSLFDRYKDTWVQEVMDENEAETGNDYFSDDLFCHMYFSHSSGYGMHINTYNTSGSVYCLELHNNTKNLFNVYNDGTTKFGGTAHPWTNNAYDLGTSSLRWRNVYTTDLQLSNEGKTNDVDGTWGDYTIQEGEHDLFLINNRSGKKYKFNLTEV